MAEEYRLPDVFVKLPEADDDEHDVWEHVRNNYRIRIAQDLEDDECLYWVGLVSEEIPSLVFRGWNKASNLEDASKKAWSAYRTFAELDRALGPVKG